MATRRLPSPFLQHCERHIQSLQTRVLELQQQLAVAVTADRKKDVMIEQLDKVPGWRDAAGSLLVGAGEHRGTVSRGRPSSLCWFTPGPGVSG